MWEMPIWNKPRFLIVAVALMGAALLLILIAQGRGAEPAMVPPPATWPTQGWRSTTAEEQGFDSAKLAEGLLAIRKQQISVHSLLLIHNGSVFLDATFYPYDGSTYHDFASVTKSMMTTLVGLAATQGKLNLDAPMVSFFPNRTIANRDARKERITVRHLASMSSGLDCTEADDEKTLREMWQSPDWVQFALDRPMSWEPGSHWVYCSPAIHLLSAVLQQATGMSALDYAQENLFKPLGIREADWPADPQGYTRGWGDLALQPRDAAKLGLLFLQQGQWEGKELVSRDWVSRAAQGYFSGTGRKEDYGYGWWVAPPSANPKYYVAVGREGQRIQVIPSMNVIVVTTGGGFEFDQIEPYIVPAIVDLAKPIPANPAGVAELQAAIAEVMRGPAAQPVAPITKMARAVSGKTFVLAACPLVQSVRLEFGTTAEATLTLHVLHEPKPRVQPVGLDGLYRPSRLGRPVIARGQWADAQTFVMDYNEGPGLNRYSIRMRFEEGGAVFEMVGVGSCAGTPRDQ